MKQNGTFIGHSYVPLIIPGYRHVDITTARTVRTQSSLQLLTNICSFLSFCSIPLTLRNGYATTATVIPAPKKVGTP